MWKHLSLWGSLRLWRWVVSLGRTLKVFRGACFGTLTSSLSHRSGSTPVWIHSTSSPSQRLVCSTTVVHQHNERVQYTVDGHGQVREDDLQSFVTELEQGERDPLPSRRDRQNGTQGLPKMQWARHSWPCPRRTTLGSPTPESPMD